MFFKEYIRSYHIMFFNYIIFLNLVIIFWFFVEQYIIVYQNEIIPQSLASNVVPIDIILAKSVTLLSWIIPPRTHFNALFLQAIPNRLLAHAEPFTYLLRFHSSLVERRRLCRVEHLLGFHQRYRHAITPQHRTDCRAMTAKVFC